jgi:archaeosortase A (PGF-CTERM-specific)
MLNKPVLPSIIDMSPAWLLSNLLWIGLILLLASAVAKRSYLAGWGWFFFGLYWLGQPVHYLAIEDYFNAALTIAAGLLCFYMGWLIAFRHCESSACVWASYAASICGIIYFPFAQVAVLQNWLIGVTTTLTVQTLQILSIPVVQMSWNVMSLNGRSVEIILACTAIESIALFAGVIVSVKAPFIRKAAALAASTLTIYILNIGRNAFVLMAYGYGWFGMDSFHVAHNVIAKIGSTIALLIIAYVVFYLLPELLATIDQLASEIKHPGGGTA